MGILNEVGQYGQEVVVKLLCSLATKQCGMVFTQQYDFQLTIAQCMVLCDHVGTGTNGLYRIKQALQVFCPALKGVVLPKKTPCHVSRMERDGVVYLLPLFKSAAL